MLESQQFVEDIAYLARYYGWDPDDLDDVLAQTESNPGEMCGYWTQLAAAHRAGYQQTPENNYMRLGQWSALQDVDVPSVRYNLKTERQAA